MPEGSDQDHDLVEKHKRLCKDLLFSPEYADLTIVCRGQEVRVHKAIVCSRSIWLKNAAGSKDIQVLDVGDEDFNALRSVVSYLYTFTLAEFDFSSLLRDWDVSAERRSKNRGDEEALAQWRNIRDTIATEFWTYYLNVYQLATSWRFLELQCLIRERIECLPDSSITNLAKHHSWLGLKSWHLITESAQVNMSEYIAFDVLGCGFANLMRRLYTDHRTRPGNQGYHDPEAL